MGPVVLCYFKTIIKICFILFQFIIQIFFSYSYSLHFFLIFYFVISSQHVSRLLFYWGSNMLRSERLFQLSSLLLMTGLLSNELSNNNLLYIFLSSCINWYHYLLCINSSLIVFDIKSVSISKTRYWLMLLTIGKAHPAVQNNCLVNIYFNICEMIKWKAKYCFITDIKFLSKLHFKHNSIIKIKLKWITPFHILTWSWFQRGCRERAVFSARHINTRIYSKCTTVNIFTTSTAMHVRIFDAIIRLFSLLYLLFYHQMLDSKESCWYLFLKGKKNILTLNYLLSSFVLLVQILSSILLSCAA